MAFTNSRLRDPKSKRKDKWYPDKDHDLFAIAGIWRFSAASGEDA
jgi:putative SOS response-associated peptidase YedK